MKIIYLNHKKKTVVDNENYNELIQHKWRFNTTGYATRSFRSISMHRQVMRAKTGEYVDHIDGDKLNNQKNNLRIVTNKQNCWNRRMAKWKTCGVSQTESGKWRSYINVDGKQKWLGVHKNKEDAMMAYDEAVIKFRGEYAVTNAMLGNYKEVK